ncbi:MAG: hypothetical protein A3B86_04430 [Candidatus Yanofskybacteria bacterium RIFCSPHIGHO2_02_FULL_38_22b]|uniref:EamA domain-containing protein n=1 Tax=Candidatus Yanofskybacteria bacterium RIFCSPHIGHO2_02_FULL_38_22b TaxID=1802673 RepID=A0A1F8F173_9BACT|nr:MAG: hypothetical protein A3B86_04430 [Candidatus Yanofskybacteria bacterium RIFCSPHIGHO2_02_FULL_38_22b]OGN19748.1 MAG: hypothetical protein A2910_04165 [Candidatus Yanofskybacteria bacterium RIFCSPLOWO2_01_FULL_39_28]
MHWLIFIGLLIVFEIIADVFSKEWSLSGRILFWTLALSGYIVANIFWLKAIRLGSGLGRGAVLFSVGSALAAMIIGVVFYKESIGKIELVGMTLGVVSIILILWHS